jgi:hypothetical protein
VGEFQTTSETGVNRAWTELRRRLALAVELLAVRVLLQKLI